MKEEGNSTGSLKAASSSAHPQPTSTNYVYQIQDRVFFFSSPSPLIFIHEAATEFVSCFVTLRSPKTTACLMVRSWYLWKAIE
jgi:hypothetical protein